MSTQLFARHLKEMRDYLREYKNRHPEEMDNSIGEAFAAEENELYYNRSLDRLNPVWVKVRNELRWRMDNDNQLRDINNLESKYHFCLDLGYMEEAFLVVHEAICLLKSIKNERT